MAGAFAFGVDQLPQPGSARTTVKTPGPSELAVVARWFYLSGLIGLLGFSFTELVVLRGPSGPGRLRWAMAASWVVAAGGLAGLTQAQASGAGLRIGDLLSSSIGHAFLVRAVTPLPAAVAPWSVAVGVILGVSVGLFFGIYPASRAAKLDPIAALRAE